MALENDMSALKEQSQALEKRVFELEKALSAKEKIAAVLMKRVERGIDNAGGAFSIFERNILLEDLVEKRTRELVEAVNRIKRLSGLLPICSHCKSIRDDNGYWQEVDEYLRDHTEAELSHSLCPDCISKLYPDMRNIPV